MSAFGAMGGSMQFQKLKRSSPGLRIVAAILALSLVALPANRALADPSDRALPGIGSVDDYMSQGQPRDREYAPQGPNFGQGSQGYNGAPAGTRSQMKPNVMGAMIFALWALQRYQERHQRRRALRNYRHSRNSRGLNHGNSMPTPYGYGF